MKGDIAGDGRVMQWQPREGTGRRIAHEKMLDEYFVGPDAQANSGQCVSSAVLSLHFLSGALRLISEAHSARVSVAGTLHPGAHALGTGRCHQVALPALLPANEACSRGLAAKDHRSVGLRRCLALQNKNKRGVRSEVRMTTTKQAFLSTEDMFRAASAPGGEVWPLASNCPPERVMTCIRFIHGCGTSALRLPPLQSVFCPRPYSLADTRRHNWDADSGISKTLAV